MTYIQKYRQINAELNEFLQSKTSHVISIQIQKQNTYQYPRNTPLHALSRHTAFPHTKGVILTVSELYINEII